MRETESNIRTGRQASSAKRAQRRWLRWLAALSLLATAPAALAQVPPSFATCDTRAFLFQSSPTDVFSVDLVTGSAPLVGADIASYNINAVGYNPLDNYIYGMDSSTSGSVGLTRVGSNFAVQVLGLPTGLPANAGFNIGEFDNNGHYWVRGPAGTVYDVDLRPGSATYFRVVSARALNAIAGYGGGADWAYNPVDGYLYSTPTNSTTGQVHLFRYNRATGVQSNLGAVSGIAPDVNILVGADYADAAGFIYASDNVSGRIFRINTATRAGTLLSTGPASGTNDGARCFNAIVPIDFGDAPDTYGTTLAANGARHSIPGYNSAAKTAPLMIGSRVSAEADGVPSTDASTDSFDDGLVAGSVSLIAGATTASATLNVTNAKGTAATLAGWIDFNGNGTFDAGERTQVTIPANTNTAQPFALNWTGLSPIPSGFSSPARFRVATTAAQVANAAGSASDGEVEDYVVPITLPPIDCTANPSIFNTAYNSANGGMLPPGTRDRNWDAGLGSATGGPSSVTSWIDAYVVGQAAASWTPSPFGNANWISYYSNATHTGNVDIYFRYRFNLDPSVVPSTFQLGIDFYADNSVWEVYVNGQPQSGLVAGLPQSPGNSYLYGGFVAGSQAHLQLDHSWQTGTNEIIVQVRSGAPLVGFMGQVTASGLCPAQVGITKTADPPGALTPNGTVVYTVTVTNTGLVPAPNTLITDPLPAGITSGTWTCADSSGAVCPNPNGTMPLNQTVATFPGGGVLTYTITGTVDANPPASVINTAQATPTGYSECYPDGGAPPCSATVANPPVPIVQITKTADQTEAIPGGPITYSVVARNTGSLAADGTTVTDPVPAGLSNVTWTCTAAGGAVCANTSGSGAINETIPTFPPGATVTFTIDATVDANPPASIANTASSTPPGGGVCNDGSPPPCESTVIVPTAPQVRVVKTANPTGVLTPGGTVTYTITATNEGSSDAPSTLVRDGFPNGIDSATWTCAASGGAVCPNADSGGTIAPPADMLNETVLTFPSGASIVYTITATVSAAPPTNVVNTASVSPPGGVCLPTNSPPPCTSTVANPSAPIIDITKTADTDLLIPGGTVTYTITVTNTGTVAADGTLVSDPIPDGLTPPFTWACAASGGAVCPNVTGVGDINESILTFPAGSTVVYTVAATVDANPPALVGNVATAMPPDGVCADGAAVPCEGSVVTPVAPQVGVTKVANQAEYTPGGTLSWTITASNLGSVAADGTLVSDPLPSGIVSSTWACVASGGAVCPHASGSGTITESIAVFPPGSTVTYAVVGTVAVPAPTSISNTVAVTPPDGGRCVPDNTLPPCTSGTTTPIALIDDGDAPDSYGTLTAGNGARHVLAGYAAATGTAPLMLGSRVDPDSDGLPGAGADGDDLDGSDDEDAFFGPIALQPGATTVSLDIPVTNATGGNANVYAWIDFNGNGRFDVAEAGTCPVVPAAATSVTCTWTGLTALVDGFQTYARLRITTQTLAPGTAPNGGDARAQGLAGDGEVEDHRATVATVLPLTCEAPFIETFRTYAEAPGAFPGWGTALPAGTTTYIFQPGSATPASTVDAGQYALLTRPSLSHTAWQNAPDHTPGDTDGFMMVVNGDPSPGVFYRHTFSGLAIGARYNFFASLANIVAGFNLGLPDVTLRIVDPATNAVLASFDTGGLPEAPNGTMPWQQEQLIFTATQSTVRVELANNSGVVGGNDVALDDIGFAQVCELGDAPDSYGTLNASNGAGHLFPGPGLSLGGGVPDGEADGHPSPNADGDDLNGIDDENAFPAGAPQLVIAAPYTLNVPVETTAGDATVCAWVDLDQNGSFSAAEGQCQSLAAGTSTASFAWAAAATTGLTSGQTYLRLRIERNGALPANLSTEDFLGVRGAGEVEDYIFPVVTPANVALVKTLAGESGSQAGIAEPGEQLTYAITLTNSGQVDAVAYGATDVLDANTTFVSADNGGTFAGGVVSWNGLTVPAGGNLVLTVVVTVNAPIPPGVTQIGNVAYETGTTQPPCPPAGPQCVVIPTAGLVTVAKSVADASGNGMAEPGEQLTYTILLTNSGGSDVTNYGVTDPLDTHVVFVSADNGGTFAGGVVTWSGLTVPAGGNVALTVVVTVVDPIPDNVTSIGNVAYQTGSPPPDCSVLPRPANCTSIPTAPQLAIAKTASAPVPTGTPNEYQITYVATVVNSGGSSGTYDLADTLTFNGATVTAIGTPVYASPTGDTQNGVPGSFVPPTGGTIVTGEDLASLGRETWTYTVTYTIIDSAVAQDCNSASGGLRNSAALGGSASGAPAAETCTGAPTVAIVKTASAPAPTGNPNEFTLTYTVDVTNTGTLAGVYDLDDTLSFNGATVTTITPPAYSSSTGDTQDGTLGAFGAPAGGTIVTGEPIAVSGAEQWTYTVTYTVTDPATAQDCANPAGGLRNDAELGGSFQGESTTCTGAPAVVIGKSVTGPVATGNPDEYRLTYVVTVQNNGTLPGLYDLGDTFVFAGVSNVTVSAVQHGGGDPLSTPLGTLDATGGSIVTNESIASGASETYTYTVTLTVDDVAAVGTCAAGGGLANQAELGGSSAGQVGTCSDVPDIAVTKTAGAPVPTGTPDQYAITYTVTVDNTGAAGGTYDLDDAFAYAGATIDAVSAITHGGADPLSTTLGTLDATGGTIVTGEPIAGASSETYTYTVTLTLTDAALAGDCADPSGGLRNDATLGGGASGDSATCVGTPDVAIVKTLANESGSQPGIAEPGEQLTYTITLTNTGGADQTDYRLTDPLDPNVIFVSADNGGVEAGGVITWTGLVVPAGGSLTLTVVVTVVDPLPSGAGSINNVAYQTGSTEPDCTVAPTPPECVVTPTEGTVAIVKSVADANGNGLAEPGETLTYTITLTNTNGGDVTNYGVTDPLDPNTIFVSADNGGVFAGGTVTWTGLTVPSGGVVTLTVVVTVVDPLPAGTTSIGNLAYETGGPPPDCSVLPVPPNCTVIPTVPVLAIGKSATAPAPTGNPNEFQITYTVTVTNSGGSVGTYFLTDTLSFNGATVTAISAPAYSSSTGDTQDGLLGTFTPPTGGTIVTGEGINALGSETWVYTVTYTVTDPEIAADCTTVLGGLRNSAALGDDGAGAPPAETCTGAASVAIGKTASVPAPTGNPNEFTLTYTVNVTNTGSLPGAYELSDVLTFNGATITAITAPSYSSSTGDTQDGTLGAFGLPDGGIIVSGESIAAGGAETWTYTVTYTVDDPAVAEDCASPNGGLRNSAALGGSFSGQSTTCTGAAAVVIGKSVSGPVATGNPNEYTLTYVVTVQNNGSLDGVYDLDDAFTFPGVSNVSVGAIAHNGPDPLATALGTLTASGGTIVTNETIAAGSSESYTYSVTFTVDSATTVGSCASGGGLVNQASLGGSSSGTVGTCSGVPDVAIAKSAVGPTPTGTPNQYTLTYTVTVSNAGGAVGTYDLADAFVFAGATIDAVSAVAHGGPDPLATALGTLTPAGGTIVTGETIAAGSSETYAYTVTLTITDPATASDCTDPNGGLRNTATLGGSVGGSAATCTGSPAVALSKALTGESGSLPGIAEAGETLTYTITLTNTGDVDATNYGVTDPLDANVVFVSADNGGTFAGGTVTWSGLTIPANGSLSLIVVVTVVDPIPAGVTEIGNLAYQTGGTPPDCTATPLPPGCVITPAEGLVSIAKSVVDANGNGLAEPGETLTYTITLTNTNGGDVTNYGVTDPLDPNVVFVSASNGGSEAGGVVTWTGLTIPAAGSLSLTVVVTVVDPLPAGVTQIGNLAYETGGTPPDCSSLPQPANCNEIPTPGAGEITITKAVADANGNGLAEPGETLTYSIVLTNTGGQDVTGYGVTDPLDPNTVFVSADNGGSAAGGVVTWTGLTVPVGGSLTLTVVVTVVDPLPSGVTQIGNLAYESGGTPPDCTATPLPPNCAVIVVPPPAGAPMLQIAKTSNTTVLEPGGTVVYTITVSNIGTAAAIDALISDPIPAGIASYAWTCTASGGVACTNASGVGAIAETIANFPVGGVLVYTVTATLQPDPPATITNTASVTPSGIAVCAPSGSPPPCTSSVMVTVIPPAGDNPVATPAADFWALLLLGLGLIGTAWRMRESN